MEHTQGKWEAKENNDGSWVVMSGSIVIAVFKRKDFPESNEPNAHLIAASPMLLEACRIAATALEDHLQYDDGESLERDGFNAVKQAIAKAEAKQ